MKKIVEQIITTLILNFLAYFLNFKFGQSLEQQQCSYLGWQTSLV